jgi:plasmid maintenance system antidote protein VapI
MNINELLAKNGITKYRLSKNSGIPHTTINDICNGKTKIEKCSADTVYKISKVLNVSMEEIIESATKGGRDMAYRSNFETFKSNVCHRVKDMGDIDFIIDTLQTDEIRKYFNKKWYPESLYLLAMVDYLSRVNNLPLCTNYNDIRASKLKSTIFPASIIVAAVATNNNSIKNESFNASIPEFKRFNIVESEVRNVF